MAIFRQSEKAKRIAKAIDLTKAIEDVLEMANDGSSDSSTELASTKIMLNGRVVLLRLQCEYIGEDEETETADANTPFIK